MNQFERAKKRLRDAEDCLLQASINEFPIGCEVQWQHGKYTRHAIVTWHSEQYARVGLKSPRGVELRPMDTAGLKRV